MTSSIKYMQILSLDGKTKTFYKSHKTSLSKSGKQSTNEFLLH